MNYNLRDLLRQVSEEKNDIKDNRYTHYSSYGPESKYQIQDQNLTKFYDGYCSIVTEQIENEEEPNLCLAEIPGNIMPLIQEFLFKFEDEEVDEEEGWEPYTDNFLGWLCYLYQNILIQYFNIVDENVLMVVVMESVDHWFEYTPTGKVFVVKVRLQFPNARIDVKSQENFIRNEMITLLRKNNIMSKMERQPIGDWDTIMLKSTKTPVMMYGSSSAKNIPILKIVHIWEKITKLMMDESYEPGEIEIEDAFNMNLHEHVRNGTVDVGIFKSEVLENHWNPMYLSLHYGSNTLLMKKSVDKKVFSKYDQTEARVFGMKSKFEYNEGEGIDMACKLLQIISPVRYQQESYWLDIGRALYNTDHGGNNGLLIWTKQTLHATKELEQLPAFLMDGVHQQREDIIKEVCRNNYDLFGQSNITIKTLGDFAKKDDMEGYNRWHNGWTTSAEEVALSGLDSEVCEALYREFWLDFVYDNKCKKWFYFDTYGWVENTKGHFLKKAISGPFVRKFEDTRFKLSDQVRDMEGKEKSDTEENVKKLTSLIAKLKTVPFKNRLMTEAEEKFGNENFSSFLNRNPNCMGVKNGLLEIVGEDIVFRQSKPEDYLSMSAGVPFHTYFHWGHPLVVETKKWLNETFPYEDLYEHFMKFCSSFIRGKNSDKIFAIFSGLGHNSKSMILKLFEATFSMYAIKIPVSLLSEKGANSGNATPQLARAKATRIAMLDEPEADSILKAGAIKRYSGGDSFYGRMLHDNGGDIELTFKMIMSTNEIPKIADPDKAVEDRVKIFPFFGKWVEFPELEEQKEFVYKRDNNFEKRIPMLATAFLWMLTQYFPKYIKYGLVPPECVVEYTKKYWADNDVLSHYISENILEVEVSPGIKDTSATVSLADIFSDYKSWHRENYGNERPPTRPAVRNSLIGKWGKMTSKNAEWTGIALKSASVINGPIDAFTTSKN